MIWVAGSLPARMYRNVSSLKTLFVDVEWNMTAVRQLTYSVADVYDATLIMWSTGCSLDSSFMGIRAWRSLSVQRGKSVADADGSHLKPKEMSEKQSYWFYLGKEYANVIIWHLEVDVALIGDVFCFPQRQKTWIPGVFPLLACEWVGGSFEVGNQGSKTKQVSVCLFYCFSVHSGAGEAKISTDE